MSSYKDRREAAANKTHKEEAPMMPQCCEGMESFWEVLAGYEQKPGVTSPGCAITFWWGDGRIKFSINDKTNKLVGYGTIPMDRLWQDAVMAGLNDNPIDWKPSRS